MITLEDRIRSRISLHCKILTRATLHLRHLTRNLPRSLIDQATMEPARFNLVRLLCTTTPTHWKA